MSPGQEETAFTHEAVPLKFGPGVSREVGHDLKRLSVSRCLLVTDPHLRSTGIPDRICESIRQMGVEAEIFDQVHSEPTDQSWEKAIEFARDAKVDGFVAVGGGSSIDTAKAANLYSSYPANLFEYVNKPIGNGTAVPGPLKPLIGIPTTAGTASECTSVAVTDIKSMKLKTGISHRFLRPSLAILDPENTLSCPPLVTACCGIDVLCHAAESFTAIPYDQKPRPPSPGERPPYNGANPVSDIWSAKSIELVSRYLQRAVLDGNDLEARGKMMLACTYAGMGFGNAGVHVPHAMGYPIGGMIESYIPPDYPNPHPMVPHGMSVIVGAPAAFRVTAAGCPEKHLEAARLMGADTCNVNITDAGEILAQSMIRLMKDIGIPNGIGELGYCESDIPRLVEGTLKQQRLLVQAPCDITDVDLSRIYRDSLRYW